MRLLCWFAVGWLIGCTAKNDTSDEPPSGEPPENPSPPQSNACERTERVGSLPIRRLTNSEIARSVWQILGIQIDEEALPRDPVIEGFETDAAQLPITAEHARAYQAMAEGISRQVLGSPALQETLLGACDPIARACAGAVISSLALRLERRPIDLERSTGLADLAFAIADPNVPNDPLAVILESLLQSPRFLFLWEQGRALSDRPGVLALDGHEIASRLSFLLWQAPPDDALLAAASSGELETAAGVRAAAERLLADPRAEDGLLAFGRSWLRLDDLADGGFPEPLVHSAAAALERTLLDLLPGDVSLLDLYRTRTVYTDGVLAPIYGVEVTGDDLVPVRLDDETPRAGIFGTPAFAMLTSSPSATSIVHRGRWVREVVLCDPIPAPPAGVDTSLQPGESPIEAVQRRAADPFCGSCHSKMDGIGLGLELLGPEGTLRDAYPSGESIPTEGSIDVDGDPTELFHGPKELSERVAQSAWARSCISRQYFRFLRGRVPDRGDRCAIEDAAEVFTDQGERFSSLILAYVESEAFRFRAALEECAP